MKERRYHADRVAHGYVHGETQRKVVILVDDETFAEVRRRAVASGRSWAAVARDLIDWGLQETEGL